jgi:hypothetical protein
VIEAFRLIVGARAPDWFRDAMDHSLIRPAEPNPPINDWGRSGMLVDTPQGPGHARLGDWVIRDEEGNLFAVKAADFELTYPVPYQGKRADLIILDELDNGSR